MECLPNKLTSFNSKIYYKEEGVDITNLINRIVQVLKKDLY